MFFPSSLARVDQLRLHTDNRLVTVRKKEKKSGASYVTGEQTFAYLWKPTNSSSSI